jgi:predicted nucleic acid-binding protein
LQVWLVNDQPARRTFSKPSRLRSTCLRRTSARAFGRVAASLRQAGRKPAARAYDALIAVSAIAHDLPLYICNPADFTGIDELSVRAVPNPRVANH